MKTTVKISVNPVTETMAKLPRVATRAEIILAQQVLKDTDKFVPALTGAMKQMAHTDGAQIIYDGPQARYLYGGKLMVDPNTGSSWAKAGQQKVLTDRDLVFSKVMNPDAQSHWMEASEAVNMDKWQRVAAKAVKNGIDG